MPCWDALSGLHRNNSPTVVRVPLNLHLCRCPFGCFFFPLVHVGLQVLRVEVPQLAHVFFAGMLGWDSVLGCLTGMQLWDAVLACFSGTGLSAPPSPHFPIPKKFSAL